MIIISRTLAIRRSNNHVIWLSGWQDMVMERRAAQLFLPFVEVVSLITFQQVHLDHIFLHIQDGTICTNRMVYFCCNTCSFEYVMDLFCVYLRGHARWCGRWTVGYLLPHLDQLFLRLQRMPISCLRGFQNAWKLVEMFLAFKWAHMQSFMEFWQEIRRLFNNYFVSQFDSSFCARIASERHTKALQGLCAWTYSMSTPIISLQAVCNMRWHQCWISITVYAFQLASRERPHTQHGDLL